MKTKIVKFSAKEYKQGEVLTFNGNDYPLIIGAPGNVRITYKERGVSAYR